MREEINKVVGGAVMKTIIYIIEVGIWINTIKLTAFNQGIKQRHPLSATLISSKPAVITVTPLALSAKGVRLIDVPIYANFFQPYY